MTLPAIIASAALVLAAASLLWSFSLQRRLAALRRVRGEFAKMAADGDLIGFARGVESSLRSLEAEDEKLRADDAAIAERLSDAVRHVGLVRFDALPGQAGKQSFSLAMLDDHGNGVVMTSIYGRGEYRLYAKPLADGDSDHALADEEIRAVDRALPGSESRRRKRA